jgi:AH receptor-interacting protein
MELIIGKKFKLEVWERAIKTMWLNEVAKFTVVKELLYDYPVAAKQLREYYESISECCSHKKTQKGNQTRQHCCSFNIMELGVGYSDLDDLLKNPRQLDFIFEIVSIEKPGEYKKDSWALTEQEKALLIPKLKEEGNHLVKQKQYKEAADKYEEALRYIEQFMFKEKPNDTEWNELNQQKLPILFNYSLCKFHLGDFYTCIENTTNILEFQENNVKALFRRAKAHMAVWNIDEAKRDYNKCLQLDSTLETEVNAQLNYLNQLILKRDKEEREKFKGKLFG